MTASLAAPTRESIRVALERKHPQSDERDATFARIVEQAPGFAGYQSATERVIPVVELQRL